MQITLNKVPFDIAAVGEPLRSALLKDPAIAPGVHRDIWEWDGEGRFLSPVGQEGAVPLPSGILTFVGRPSDPLARADGPSKAMAERLLAAVGAKTFAQLMAAMARITGIPQKKVPFDAFTALRASGPHVVEMETEFSVLSLGHAGRNLLAYLFVPGLVVFTHRMKEGAEGPAAGSIRSGFVIPPVGQAIHAMRRMAVARRLLDLQEDLAGQSPANLPEDDPRRDAAGRLGAEWKVLQPQPKVA